MEVIIDPVKCKSYKVVIFGRNQATKYGHLLRLFISEGALESLCLGLLVKNQFYICLGSYFTIMKHNNNTNLKQKQSYKLNVDPG